MEELLSGVSWAGILVGAIAAFVLGWLWYSPMLFGKKWAEGHGIDLGSASEMPMAAMATQLVGLFLMSWFVGVTAVNDALLTVVLATLAFTVLGYSGGMFGKQNTYVRNVNAGYWIVSLIVMFISQAIF